MSKIIIEKYKCDICGKEVEKEADLRKETVPCYGEGSFFTQISVDMCDNCASRLRKIIYQNFAEIRDNYGLTVKQVFKKDDLSIVSNQEYRKENDNRLKWEPISGSDEMEEAEKILAHIKEVGGVQNYFTELMDKLDFHTVKTPEKTVVSLVEKLPDGFVRVQQLNNSLYKIMEEGTAEQEDAIMVTLGRNVKLRKCKNIDEDVSK